MKKIFDFIKLDERKLDILLFILYGAYIFTNNYFYRAGFSKIPNALLVVVLVVAILKTFYCKIHYINVCSVFFGVLGIFVLISNLIQGIFSYDFILLFAVCYTAFILFYKKKTDYVIPFLVLNIIPKLLAMGLICLHYLRAGTLLTSQFGADNFFMNRDALGYLGGTTIGYSLCFLGCLKKKDFKNKPLIFIPLLIAAIITIPVGAFVSLRTERLGSIISVIIFLFILVLYNLIKKRKFVLLSLFLVIALVFFGFVIFGPIENISVLNRIRLSIMQIIYPHRYYDNSVKERFYLLGRDFVYMFQTPIFGLGYNSYYNFNVMTGHNGFGSASNHYGMFYIVLIILMYCLIVKRVREKTGKGNVVALFLIFSVLFSMVYAMPFTSRGTFFSLGYLMGCYLDGYSSARIVLKKNNNGKRKIAFEISKGETEIKRYSEIAI